MSSALAAMARGRCPRCRRGAIFARGGFPGMPPPNERCPECRLLFLREPGYFLGAMYISYAMVVAVIAAALGLYALATDWSWETMLLATLVPVVLLTPVMVTASRVLWIWFDRRFDPEDA